MVRLIHGEAITEMRKLEDGSIDCCIADLPYGYTQNEWDIPIPFEDMWKELKRIVKPNGAICLFCDGMFMAKLMISGEDIWRYNLVWDKKLSTGFLNANRMPLRRHEEICVFYQVSPEYHPQKTIGLPVHDRGKQKNTKNNNYGDYGIIPTDTENTMKHPTSIIEIQKVHPSKSVHPTEKPVELIEWLVKSYTSPGETVLDFCMGSGTTMLACINTERNGIGIELDKDYFDIAKKRVDNHGFQFSFFGQ